MKRLVLILSLFSPFLAFAQIIKNEDISMRDFPVDYLKMLAQGEYFDVEDTRASYAIIKGEVSCKRNSALSLAQRDKISKKYQKPFEGYSTAVLKYTGGGQQDLIIKNNSKEDVILSKMCEGRKTVKAAVYVLEPPGSGASPTYNYLMSIRKI